jgi:hypothetical protein
MYYSIWSSYGHGSVNSQVYGHSSRHVMDNTWRRLAGMTINQNSVEYQMKLKSVNETIYNDTYVLAQKIVTERVPREVRDMIWMDAVGRQTARIMETIADAVDETYIS